MKPNMEKFNRATLFGLPMHASALPGHKYSKAMQVGVEASHLAFRMLLYLFVSRWSAFAHKMFSAYSTAGLVSQAVVGILSLMSLG